MTGCGGEVDMRRLLLLLILFGCIAGPAVAGPYEDGLAGYRRGDFAAALSSYRIAANQGHAKAQCKLGLMYEFGLGVGRDYAEAAKWFRKAAEQGDAEG
jgi:TPR repeat protein